MLHDDLKNTMNLPTFAFSAAVGALLIGHSLQAALPLLPSPARAEEKNGAFVLTDATALLHSPEFESEATLLATQLRRSTGLPLPLEVLGAGQRPKRGALSLVVSDAVPDDDEAYQLDVTRDGAIVRARGKAGAFYATRSLLQLLPPQAMAKTPARAVLWKLPACRISDSPRFRWRGAHLDVSRHYQDVGTVKRFIDRIAALKMNVFHWHLTDDDGWRVEIGKYPKLTGVGAWRPAGARVDAGLEPAKYHNARGEYGGFYTRGQVREIIAYAAARHVHVLPEIDLPGHCQAVNRAYPEFTAGNSNVMSGSGASLGFMRDVLDEIIALFPYPYIHIGGDEVGHGAWKNDPPSVARMEELGITGDPRKLQDWITLQLKDHLSKKGVTIIGWDELIDHDAPKDITLMAWRNSHHETMCAKAGYQTIAAPLPECYLNYNADPLATFPGHGFYGVTLRRSFLWDPAAGLTPDEAENIIGGQSCIWTEYIPREKDLDWLLYPRLLALAETFWSPRQQESGWEDFLARVGAEEKRMDQRGIQYEIPRPAAPFEAAVFSRRVSLPAIPSRDGITLRHTLDGSEPTAGSPELDRPVTIDSDGTLMLSAFRSADHHSHPTRIRLKKTSPETTAGNLVPGLWSSYSEGDWKLIPDSRFLIPEWTREVPQPSLGIAGRDDRFLLDFTGYIRIDSTGVYGFTTGSDDGSILDIASIRIVDNDGLHGYATRSGKVFLERGIHPLRIAFLEGTGNQTLDLFVTPPGGEPQAIPANWFLRDKVYAPPSRMSLETTLPVYQNNPPECAVDGLAATHFWANRAPVEGDHFTIRFEGPERIGRLRATTGKGGGDRLEQGALEISSDGENWKVVAKFKDGSAAARLTEPVRAIRIRCTADQGSWLAISEIMME